MLLHRRLPTTYRLRGDAFLRGESGGDGGDDGGAVAAGVGGHQGQEGGGEDEGLHGGGRYIM